MLARLLPDLGMLLSVQGGDAVLYIVEIRRENADLAMAMSGIPEWFDAQRFEPDAFRYTSGHAGVILAALGDGSVRTVSSTVNPTTWLLANSPNDGQVLPGDW